VYGSDAVSGSLLDNVEPWSGGQGLRPWAPPENQQVVKSYKDLSIIAPPCYDSLPSVFAVTEVLNPSGVINFNDVPAGETTARGRGVPRLRLWRCHHGGQDRASRPVLPPLPADRVSDRPSSRATLRGGALLVRVHGHDRRVRRPDRLGDTPLCRELSKSSRSLSKATRSPGPRSR
jgi:hypothetical protein